MKKPIINFNAELSLLQETAWKSKLLTVKYIMVTLSSIILVMSYCMSSS